MRWIGLAMQLDEKPLGISVKTALTHLIGMHFDERVVSALLLHGEMKSSKQSGESA